LTRVLETESVVRSEEKFSGRREIETHRKPWAALMQTDVQTL
jgi:hypothetical protein